MIPALSAPFTRTAVRLLPQALHTKFHYPLPHMTSLSACRFREQVPQFSRSFTPSLTARATLGPAGIPAQKMKKVFFPSLDVSVESFSSDEKTRSQLVKALLNEGVSLISLLKYFRKDLLDPAILLNLLSDAEARKKLIDLSLNAFQDDLQLAILSVVDGSRSDLHKVVVAKEMVEAILAKLISPHTRNETWDPNLLKRVFRYYISCMSDWLRVGADTKHKEDLAKTLVERRLVFHLFEDKHYHDFREIASKIERIGLYRIFSLLMETSQTKALVEFFQKCVGGKISPYDNAFFLRSLHLNKDHKNWPALCKELDNCFTSHDVLQEFAFASGDPIIAEILSHAQRPVPKFLETYWPGKFLNLAKAHKICSDFDITQLTWIFHLGLKLGDTFGELFDQIPEAFWESYFSSFKDPMDCKQAYLKMLSLLGRKENASFHKATMKLLPKFAASKAP